MISTQAESCSEQVGADVLPGEMGEERDGPRRDIEAKDLMYELP